MVSCRFCTARFSASPEIERVWTEMHDWRFHRDTRATARPPVSDRREVSRHTAPSQRRSRSTVLGA